MKLLGRSINAGLAYSFSVAASLVTVLIMNHEASGTSLKQALLFLFFAQILAGLDSGSVKSVLIEQSRCGQEVNLSWKRIVWPAGIKGFLIGLFISPIWIFLNGSEPKELEITLTSVLCGLTGFVITDARTYLDSQGQFGRGTWLKQGGLALASLGFCFVFIRTDSWLIAGVFHMTIRLAWVAFVIGEELLMAPPISFLELIHSERRLKWVPIFLIACLSAASGSLDRLTASNLLSINEMIVYFTLFEFFSKAWAVPYFFSPIVFSYRLRGESDAKLVALISATLFVALAGSLLAGFIVWRYPALLGLSEEGSAMPSLSSLFVFIVAICINSVAQLLYSDLQAKGRSVYILKALGMTLLVTLPIFQIMALQGIAGLLFAWLIKSLLELVLAFYGHVLYKRPDPAP